MSIEECFAQVFHSLSLFSFKTPLLALLERIDIVQYITRGGEMSAYTFVPPMHGYEPPESLSYDPEEARRLLTEAGYPDGRGFPKLTYLYNTLEAHRDVAEVLQQQWKENLGIDIELVNQEWKVYLDSQRNLEYDLSRSAWVGDYVDPNTFLDMFVTGGGNNNTGWSSEKYDALIARAARTLDNAERMRIFRRAEQILVVEEPPLIPIHYYVVKWMYPSYVRGAPPNLLGELFLKNVWIDKGELLKKTENRVPEEARPTLRDASLLSETGRAVTKGTVF